MTTCQTVIKPPNLKDLDAVQCLLKDAALPPVDERTFGLDGLIVATACGKVVAAAGIELCGRYGLLRSVVVHPAWRSKGLGKKLVADRIAFSRSRKLVSLYLLTTTAAAYFEQLGFERTDRQSAPPEIQASTEFRNMCPPSAICLIMSLT